MHNEFTYINDNGNIASRVICGKNLRYDLDETCEDEWGHGTHVASILGGKTYGVAKNITLISIKVFGKDSTSRFSNIIAGIDYVMKQKFAFPNSNQPPILINLSLGTNRIATLLNNAVTNAVNAGITVIVASGNGNINSCTCSPSSANKVITVGATTINE